MPRLALPLAGDSVIRPYTGDVDEDIAEIKTIKAANAITGGLSKPSKMPEYGYSTPADECQVGLRLQEIRGSVCQRCYALTNRFRMPNVKAAMRRRFESLPHPLWVPAMVLLIRKRLVKNFRWHDSGDVQSVEHQLNIAKVAEYTPYTDHWQPSREIEYIGKALEWLGAFPRNLVVRMSAHMIDAPPPSGFPHTSTVTATRQKSGSHHCPAPDQGNVCGDCRACWDPNVKNVSYWLH